jgi:hypothetical protein
MQLLECMSEERALLSLWSERRSLSYKNERERSASERERSSSPRASAPLLSLSFNHL